MSIFVKLFLNSSPPSAAYMRQWIRSALVQIIACRLLGANHYLNQCWVIVIWTLRNKLQWNFNLDTKLFIHEIASEIIICEMAAILSWGRWVNYRCAGRLFHHYLTLNWLAPVWCGSNFKSLNMWVKWISWALLVKLFSNECQRKSLIISQD